MGTMTRTTARPHARPRQGWREIAVLRRVEALEALELGGLESGGAESPGTGSPAAEPLYVTLLELVEAVTSVADDEREVVATVVHMLRSGSVRLCGTFRNTPW